ncbi:MAG: hypothetical protein AAB250_00115 [Bdellovibrionota bacterium]
MKKMITVLTILLCTSNAFAGSKDLKTMNTLIDAGAATEQFMSQVHLGLDEVECAYSVHSKTYVCHADDISGNEGQGAGIKFEGKAAKRLFNALVADGGTTDGGMGKIFVSAKAFRCSQSVEGVADGSEAERTGCYVQVIVE